MIGHTNRKKPTIMHISLSGSFCDLSIIFKIKFFISKKEINKKKINIYNPIKPVSAKS